MKVISIHWSEEAIKNLNDILDHIKRDSETRAFEFGKKLTRSVERLSRFPESGRVVPELVDQTPQPREIIVGNYRIIYRILSKQVEIVTVFHGRRQLKD